MTKWRTLTFSEAELTTRDELAIDSPFFKDNDKYRLHSKKYNGNLKKKN
ncbi:23085_t:CDS:1, partial [Racocetra persica]